MYLPLIGALMEAAGTILEKKVLRGKKIDFRNYTVFEFFAIVLMMIPILFFTWGLYSGALEYANIIRFLFIIVISVFANLLVFYSLKRKKVTEFEPIWVMQPLFTILLAFIFYNNERNWIAVGLALIASITLVWSHVEKHHLAFDRYIIAALLGSFCFSLELVVSKPILQYYSPFTFYFIRCFFIFLITLFIFRPSFRAADKKSWIMILCIGLMWVFYRAIIYYGYSGIGIVYTTLLFILSPVFMFIFAVVFLKEKPNWKQIVSTIVIVACVAVALLLQT